MCFDGDASCSVKGEVHDPRCFGAHTGKIFIAEIRIVEVEDRAQRRAVTADDDVLPGAGQQNFLQRFDVAFLHLAQTLAVFVAVVKVRPLCLAEAFKIVDPNGIDAALAQIIY